MHSDDSQTARIIALHATSTTTTAADLLDTFCARYPNPGTATGYRSNIGRLFDLTGCTDPADLTEGDIAAWATEGNAANNTVRNRISKAATFLRWCARHGHGNPVLAEDLADRDHPLRSYRRTYGKVQGRNPGRWLTHEEAYGRLVGACQDGTALGIRDELAIRLGLLGLRSAEIAHLTADNLAHLPAINWTAKGPRPRTVTAGPALCALIGRYLTAYTDAIGRPLTPTDPITCRQVTTRGERRPDWGHPLGNGHSGVFVIVTTRAAQAGLGHVAPHDLRRSCAGILHRSVDEHGAHYFDLLDIQKMLGHANPATTMRSYLDPMDTGVIDRAATVLD